MPRFLAFALGLICLAPPVWADRSYRMVFEGREIAITRVAHEPSRIATAGPAGKPMASEAMRVGNAADSAQALRALEVFCAMPVGQLKDFGAYGDPFWHDRRADQWVVWFDCAPQLRREGAAIG